MNTSCNNSALNGAPNSRVGDVTREADRSPGFSLIEIMVVVALLSIIILGLLAMFNETQLAFRTSMTQTDVLEAGRMFTDMAGREMEQMTPSYSGSNFVYNFYSAPPLNRLATQPTVGLPGMPGGTPFLRTNVMSDDVYFLARQNQTWSGIGYFVRSNLVNGSGSAPVGTLYRWTTNASTVRFAQNPGALWNTFNNVCNGVNASPNLSALGISKIMDGVVHFSVRAYDLNGNWINPLGFNTAPYIRTNTFKSPLLGEVEYFFRSNAVPAYVEVELGVLEDRTFQHYQALPPGPAQNAYLSNHVGQVHLFRRRIAIRNVDPGAYQ